MFPRSRYIILARPYSSFSTLKACNTQRPATIALVVAIAGMILPAICLMSNFDFGSMPKICARRFAVAVTKSRVSSSSLLKVMIGVGRLLWRAVARSSDKRLASRDRLSRKTTKLSAVVQIYWSAWDTDGSMMAASALRASYESGSGGDRSFHISSILARRSMSSLKTLSKICKEKSSAPMDSLILFSASASSFNFAISCAFSESSVVSTSGIASSVSPKSSGRR